MKLRPSRMAQLERLVMIGYVLIVIWVLLGRPDVRVRIMYLTRKALRSLASGASGAAQHVEDAMLDLATANTT